MFRELQLSGFKIQIILQLLEAKGLPLPPQ